MNAPFLTAQLLSTCTGATLLRAGLFSSHLQAAMARWGIDTPARQAAFLAQIGHESMRLTRMEEALNYTAPRLTQVWPSRFPTLADAQPFAGRPEALANRVYGGRMGNDQPGDGWRYRGRGLKQLTGRDNYTRYAQASGHDAVGNPDLLLTHALAADSAGWFWHWKGCNVFADKRDWAGLTRRINGGTVGLQERIALTTKALKAFSVV